MECFVTVLVILRGLETELGVVWGWAMFLVLFETGPHYVDKADLPPCCWDYRFVPQCLVSVVVCSVLFVMGYCSA